MHNDLVLFRLGVGLLLVTSVSLLLAHKARQSSGFFSRFEGIFNTISTMGLFFGLVAVAVALINLIN